MKGREKKRRIDKSVSCSIQFKGATESFKVKGRIKNVFWGPAYEFFTNTPPTLLNEALKVDHSRRFYILRYNGTVDSYTPFTWKRLFYGESRSASFAFLMAQLRKDCIVCILPKDVARLIARIVYLSYEDWDLYSIVKPVTSTSYGSQSLFKMRTTD